MAEDLDDGEFWLPSEFLTDDIFMEKEEEENKRGFQNQSKLCFGHYLPYAAFDLSESNLSSSVGSTETPSDEEDHLAGLSLRISQSLALGEPPAFWNDSPKTMKPLAGSPQSTLCEVGSWSGRSDRSSRASSNGPSQVSSPPATPMDQKDDAWDLLYAAAGQVMRMKMNDEQLRSNGRGLLGPPRKPVSVPVSAPRKMPVSGCYSDEAFSHLQMQHNQFQLLKQQQQLRQQLQNRARAGALGHGRCGRPVGSSSSYPIPQQQAGSGMRAIFLESSASKRESVGTGVFLPRRVGNPSEMRKKPACSTVLVPARVVQALNLNLDELGSAQPRFQSRVLHDHEAGMAYQGNSILSQQRRHIRPHHPSIAAANYEIRLPQEWTY